MHRAILVTDETRLTTGEVLTRLTTGTGEVVTRLTTGEVMTSVCKWSMVQYLPL